MYQQIISLNPDTIINGSKIEVTWAKPVLDKQDEKPKIRRFSEWLVHKCLQILHSLLYFNISQDNFDLNQHSMLIVISALLLYSTVRSQPLLTCCSVNLVYPWLVSTPEINLVNLSQPSSLHLVIKFPCHLLLGFTNEKSVCLVLPTPTIRWMILSTRWTHPLIHSANLSHQFVSLFAVNQCLFCQRQAT